MPVATTARPDLAAYRAATTAEFSTIVRELSAILGKKLTAYIGGVKDIRAVERWIAGSEPYKEAEPRLRFSFRLAKMLEEYDSPRIVQAWFTGLNPELNDRVPIRLLREGDLDKIGPQLLGAARAFVAGG